MSSIKRITALPAIISAFGMLASPLAAADLAPAVYPHFAPHDAIWSAASQTVYQHRRHHWRHDRYRHRDRVDAGDVVAGVLIIGGIAAIANAVKNRRERNYRHEDYRYGENEAADWRYREGAPYRERSGLENAAALCADEVEREARVDRVDKVERNASGWQVEGTLFDGAGFICRIGPDGRIDNIDYSLRRDRVLYRDRAREDADY